MPCFAASLDLRPVCTLEHVLKREKTRKPRLDEAAIKALTLTTLRNEGLISTGSIVASELIVSGASRRIDLATFADDLIGIEVKSEFDTLRRLEGQIANYLCHFEKVFLVVAAKHAECLKAIPEEVGCFVLTSDGVLFQDRPAARAQSIDPLNLARLLTNEELRRHLLSEEDLERPSRRDLLLMACERPGDAVRAAVSDAFATRYGETSRAFWRTVRSSPVKSRHLHKLSRYAPKKKMYRAAQRRIEENWATWHQSADQFFSANRTAACTAALGDAATL